MDYQEPKMFIVLNPTTRVVLFDTTEGTGNQYAFWRYEYRDMYPSDLHMTRAIYNKNVGETYFVAGGARIYLSMMKPYIMGKSDAGWKLIASTAKPRRRH